MDETQEQGRKPLFKREHIIKLSRLINMRYKPAELAKIIGVNVDTIYRSYLPAGAPYERDGKGNLWIIGPSFREWVFTYVGKMKRKKHETGDGQAWCMRCNRVVTIINPRLRKVNRYLNLLQGACEYCGGKVNRATGTAGKYSRRAGGKTTPQEAHRTKKTDQAISNDHEKGDIP